MRSFYRISVVVLAVAPLFATPTVALKTGQSSPQPLGATVGWSASASDTTAGTLDYQFLVSYNGGTFQVAQDYDISNTFSFSPYLKEGTYSVEVIARNTSTAQKGTAIKSFSFSALASAGVSVVTGTQNPLVALYSSPACASGSTMYVVFSGASTTNKTNTLACDGATTMNFYVAGMYPKTAYTMTDVTVTNGHSVDGKKHTITTGSVGSSLAFPTLTINHPANSQTSTTQSVLLLDYIGDTTHFYFPTAYDLSGNIIWYLPQLGVPNQNGIYFIKPLPGGNILAYINQPSTTARTGQILRIFDLVGNTVKQTDVTNINRELASLGKAGINDLNHDATVLPNGHIIVLASQEQIYPAGTQGSTASVDIIGNAIIDLDTNLQVSWYWSGWDQLDINRAAVLGETCVPNQGGCPPVLLAPVANDWLHGNSVFYISSSGDLLLSMRHQDWIAKIDYKNGTGSGAVLWELGSGGNWTINSTDPSPWFSHQHDAEYELGGTSVLSIYDNGNTRVVQNPGLTEHSRGYVLSMDESTMTCTPTMLADLGAYSVAVGSAERLNNGNYFFESGFIPGASTAANSIETLPTGAINWEITANGITYRGYRMDSLYQIAANQQ